mgnify:CR=1 FL=1
MIQKSLNERRFWAQFDALEMGTGWDESDITKPQIMVESVYGDSHPAAITSIRWWSRLSTACMKKAASLPSTMPPISATLHPGPRRMNFVLASREAIANMVEIHGCAVPWDA